MDSYLILFTVCALIGTGLFGLFRMHGRGAVRGLETDLAWMEDFSVSKYRPMLRLLSEDDFRFLRQQPGYRPQLGRSLRHHRRQVFQLYLRSLCRDFNRLYYTAKHAVLHSPEGVDLCGALARHRAVFYYALAGIQLRLVLYRFGLATVDVQPLMGVLDEISMDLRALRPLLVRSSA